MGKIHQQIREHSVENALPFEVFQLVTSFNPEHRIKYAKSLKEVEKHAIWMRVRVLQYLYGLNDFEGAFDDLLEQYVQDHELFMRVLSQCKCCSRHQVNRPCTPDDTWEELDVHRPEKKLEHECACHCRTMCRHMHRAARRIRQKLA